MRGSASFASHIRTFKDSDVQSRKVKRQYNERPKHNKKTPLEPYECARSLRTSSQTLARTIQRRPIPEESRVPAAGKQTDNRETKGTFLKELDRTHKRPSIGCDKTGTETPHDTGYSETYVANQGVQQTHTKQN